MTKQTEQTEVVKIRLGSSLKSQLQKLADANERTLAGQIRLALGQWIENQEGRAGNCGMPRYSKQQRHAVNPTGDAGNTGIAA
jgi:hypothetical protein